MSPLGIWRSLYDEQPVVVELFELLWKCGARVPIPDTLVYKFGRLDAWFFVSKSGQLKQKKNQTVVSQNIFDKVRAAFCDGLRHANDIAAVWAGGAPGSPARILHITRDNLLPFLLEMPDKGHGVLQRWITPTTEHNALVRCLWTPHVFELEVRQNSLSMHDARHPLAERLATFEGNRRHVSTYTPSSGRINQHVLDQSAAYATRRRAPLDERCAQFFAARSFSSQFFRAQFAHATMPALRYTASRCGGSCSPSRRTRAVPSGSAGARSCSSRLSTKADSSRRPAHRRRHGAADADAFRRRARRTRGRRRRRWALRYDSTLIESLTVRTPRSTPPSTRARRGSSVVAVAAATAPADADADDDAPAVIDAAELPSIRRGSARRRRRRCRRRRVATARSFTSLRRAWRTTKSHCGRVRRRRTRHRSTSGHRRRRRRHRLRIGSSATSARPSSRTSHRAARPGPSSANASSCYTLS